MPLLWRLRRHTAFLCERRGQQQRCQTAHDCRPLPHLLVLLPTRESYGFAVTSSCTCNWSSTSKSAYNSSFLCSACRSPTAVPGCTGRPRDGGLVAMVSVCEIYALLPTNSAMANITAASDIADAGRRSQLSHPAPSHPAAGRAISSRRRACRRVAKYGGGPGAR